MLRARFIGALLKALGVFLIATGLQAGLSDMSHSGSFTLYKLSILRFQNFSFKAVKIELTKHKLLPSIPGPF